MGNSCQVRLPATRGSAQPRLLWVRTVLLGLGLIAIYSANNRDLGSYDTAPTSMMLLTLSRGEGIYLDRFRSILHDASHSLPVFVRPWRNHIISRYPIAPALLVQPLVFPQVILTDRVHPGWDRSPQVAFNECKWLGRRSMAVLVSLTAVLLYRFLLRLGLQASALPALLAAALGSSLWSTGSQAMWQHGPAALALMVVITFLHPLPVSRWRLVLASVAASALFCCRLVDVVFVVMTVLWLVWFQPRGLIWFLPVPLLLGGLLINYNLTYFGEFEGGQAELERLHLGLHNLPGPWSGKLLDGLTGTLLSPSRGLFIFSPWVALAIIMIPCAAARIRECSLIPWFLTALVPYLLLFSKYGVWWGGHCFGPRYWTDVIPLFAVLLAYGVGWASHRSRGLYRLFILTITMAIGVQIIGAFCYPSSWNLLPEDVDTHHQRLWDWRDTELTRCLQEAWEQRIRRRH
jgi:hypothetical protein